MIDSVEKSQKWHKELIAHKAIESLSNNNIDGCYVENAQAACKKILNLIPSNSKVGYGGSLTLDQIGIKEKLRNGNYNFIDRQLTEIDDYKQNNLRRESLLSDVFLMSTNALTLEGQLVNMDGIGNRVAALIFGPPKIIVVAGINKIVPDVEAAIYRIKNYVAPIHAKRRDRKLPCAKTGYCVNCHAPERFCNALVVIEHQYLRNKERITVIIVGQDLGL